MAVASPLGWVVCRRRRGYSRNAPPSKHGSAASALKPAPSADLNGLDARRPKSSTKQTRDRMLSRALPLGWVKAPTLSCRRRESRALSPAGTETKRICEHGAVTTAVAFALLTLDLAIGAATVWGIGWVVFWLATRASRHAPVGGAVDEPMSTARRERGRCHRSWLATPGVELSSFGLRLRRMTRRRQRRNDREPPAWSRQKAWSRCPSCLSTHVFMCGDPAAAARGAGIAKG